MYIENNKFFLIIGKKVNQQKRGRGEGGGGGLKY
jgi:hypothetical protein